MLGTMQEKRPLKRPRLGPPDIYPQEAKQKEDELTSTNVKHGFTTSPQLSEEFGTARNCNVTASKVGAYFNAILARKEELMTLPDSGRKKQQVNPKDNFWPVTGRTKSTLDTWFKDLAGTKPLSSLAKKAPSFNKKEEIFSMLCDNRVTMQRAAWFIKLSSAYTVAVSEAKIKKRQMPDPATEWTGTLIKFMKDLIPKLQEHYHQGAITEKILTPSSASSSSSSSTTSSGGMTPTSNTTTTTIPQPLTSPAGSMHSPANSLNSSSLQQQIPMSPQDEQKWAIKQFSYCTQLSKYMYEEGLLDKQEFLNWILDLLDKMRSQPSDDGILKLYLPLTLQYMSDFVLSERLSRRLAYLVAKKVTHLLNNASDISNNNTTQIQAAEPIKIEGQASTAENAESAETAEENKNKIAPPTTTAVTTYTSSQPMSTPSNTTVAVHTNENLFNEYANCPHHSDLVMQLSVILQVVTKECPTALVWSGIGENRSSSVLVGSPLDYLQIAPSMLPMPSRCHRSNIEIRNKLMIDEENIKLRSRHAEARWCTDKWQNANANTNARILATLDALDSHCFDRMDTTNSLETLYVKIFPPLNLNNNNCNNLPNINSSHNNAAMNTQTSSFGVGGGSSSNITMSKDVNCTENKENKYEYNPLTDAPIVQILCEWAVSWQRWGEHRPMAVAWLLDKRQTEVWAASDNDNYSSNNGNNINSSNNNNNSDDKDSMCSGYGLNGGIPVFQNLLMQFLDKDAPVLEENGTPQNRVQFTNLVHLFSELIRHDVFSHDAYMCTLIARGDLLTATVTQISKIVTSQNIVLSATTTTKPSTPNIGQNLDDDVFAGIDFKTTNMREEFDDSNVDDDLDKLLQHIKEDQQNSMDAPDSPKESDNNNHHSQNTASQPTGNIMPVETSTVCRHFLYTKHFPLSQDDPLSQHDCNQRYVLLFGVGKDRDEKKHIVKKISKEICKLFSKKFSIDVAEGGKVKKHSRNEFNFEATSSKCQNLSYFDQHVVTWQCAVTVQEMLNSFALGNSNYLPVQEHVAFLFDLMETALNIYGLIDMCIQILKELPEVELQLIAKNSVMVKSYTTSLSLYVVGVLRRYHCCLLLSSDQTSSVFEGLCKIVKHVTNPSDCSSAERCILAYLYDLYSACSLLKAKPQQTEPFHNAYPKIKQSLYAPLQPMPSVYGYNMQLMTDVLTNPKRGGKIEMSWSRQLNESAANRYSFVCNAIIAVARETDNDRLNDIAAMCAELTACCNALSAEWLGVLKALCGSSIESGYYVDVLSQVDVQNINIHNSLAVFTCILVARHCFSLENFVVHVALPALVNACNGGRGDISPEIEAGARLSCHLLLRLFKTIESPQPGMYSVSTSPNPITTPGTCHSIKLSCDRHLLAATYKNIGVGPVLAVLKGILVVGDANVHKTNSSSGKRSGLNTPVHPGSTPKSGTIDLSHILGTSDLGIMGGSDEPMLDLSIDIEAVSSRSIHSRQHMTSSHNENATSLSEFAQHVLRQICSQEWVLERCLQNAEDLCLPGMLIDNMLTSKQAQRLLHMICYPENESNFKSELDQKSIIVRILENLEQWSLRISWLDLQLMFKQTNAGTPDLSNWLDTVARAAIDVFQTNPNESPNNKIINDKAKSSMWLVAPLVSKLPPAVQGRILRVAGQVLESTNMFSVKTKENTVSNNGNVNAGSNSNSNSNSGSNQNGNSNSSFVNSANNNSNSQNFTNGISGKHKTNQINHQPFLGLVLACLKGQDEQKEGLLQSLHTQLSQFLQNKDLDTIGGIEDPRGREEMLDALQLRFSLVGGMFDAIQKNHTLTTDWAILLAQLISQGVIDLTNNSELFTTVLDMLATLIHSTLISDSQSERDENKKLYTNLMKKLRKELGDKNNSSIKYVRQLLPLAKQTCEVITCETLGGLTDTKGNKIQGFDSIDKKNGLRLSDKQRVSVWDLLEGHKNPAPLSWAWFGAVKLERKPLAYEETHRLLKYHTHSLVKPDNYFYESIPLPPEELEPVPDKLKDELKADTPTSDQSPAGSSRKGKGIRRRKKSTINNVNANNNNINPAQQQISMTPQQTLQQQLQNPNINHMQQMNMQNQMSMGQQQQQQQQQQQYQQNQNQMMIQQNQNIQNNGPMNPNMVSGGMVPMGNNQQNQQIANMGNIYTQQMNPQVSQMNMNPIQQQQQPQQAPQPWSGYSQPNQIQQQQFYNQTAMPAQMNRFERPQIIQNQSKQALSNMLRSRHPFMGVQGNASGGFGMQNQQPNPMQSQPQQQRSAANAQQFIRMRGPAGPNQLGNQSVGMVAQPGGLIGQPVMVGQTGVGGINQLIGTNMGTNSNMLSQQSNVINPNSMLGQQGQNVNMSMGGQNAQNSGMMNQNSNMMTNSSGVGNPNMVQIQGGLNQNSGIVGNMGMMQGQQQQTNANMMGQQGMGGMQNMQQVGSNATVPQQQQQMFQNQQYQNMNQQYQGYNQPQQQQAAMNQQQQQQNVVQQNMMGNQFGNAIGQQPQRSSQAEYITQQRALANRNQYATMQQQQAPNVTMNNMVGGPQGTAPPYPHNVGRQGKPNINAAVNQGNMGTQQQQFHQQQQQRMRQMQILQQQQQQQGNPQNMPQNQGQVMNPQQTPALLAQLQRNQQQNMMSQQYSHQPPPY